MLLYYAWIVTIHIFILPRSVILKEMDESIAFSVGQNSVGSFQDFISIYNDTDTKFMLYDVNPGEGFNLRRDVHIRAANLIKTLRDSGKKWILVLPPWRRMYHWTSEAHRTGWPWHTFFDVEQLNKYVNTIEFDDYVKIVGEPIIDEILYLQRYDEPFKNGWEEKIEEVPCKNKESVGYWKNEKGLYRGFFGGREDVRGRSFKCVAAQGHATILTGMLDKVTGRSILVDRFEEVLHIHYGGPEFWRSRRSLVFAKHLRNLADEFRAKVLNSTDSNDNTPYNDRDWRLQIPKDGAAQGGPYLAIHLRRRDFLYAHKEGVPTIAGARRQIKKILKENKVKAIFLATDGTDEEVNELQSKLKKKIYRFQPSKEVIDKYGDGGVAIIDQWICAHGRYFIGTCLSTFSFRIHEERDILGFHPDKTFNCFCSDDQVGKCEQPTRWRVTFD